MLAAADARPRQLDLLGERAALEVQPRSLGIDGQVNCHGQRLPAEVEAGLARADSAAGVLHSSGASVALLGELALERVPALSDIASNRSWLGDEVNGVNGVLSAIEPVAIAGALALERVDIGQTLTRSERGLEALVPAPRGRVGVAA